MNAFELFLVIVAACLVVVLIGTLLFDDEVGEGGEGE